MPVHCYAHSLNLCLQDIGRNIICIRELVGQVGKLIKLSPKQPHLFSTKLDETNESTTSLKSLCMTKMDCSNWYYRCHFEILESAH